MKGAYKNKSLTNYLVSNVCPSSYVEPPLLTNSCTVCWMVVEFTTFISSLGQTFTTLSGFFIADPAHVFLIVKKLLLAVKPAAM